MGLVLRYPPTPSDLADQRQGPGRKAFDNAGKDTHTVDAKLINYQRPTLKDNQPKAVKMLARTDRAFLAVQVVREGGENNLHSHAHVDGFWFVLSGRARFYTTDDELLGECGPLEGVLVPREFPYWFESCGADELEILQFEASDIALGEPNADRVDHMPQKAWMDFGNKTRSS